MILSTANVINNIEINYEYKTINRILNKTINRILNKTIN